MLTETVTWRPVADGLPDAETNVLLTLAGDEPGTCEGFLDGEWENESHRGLPLFRDVTAQALPPGDVTHWADMPGGAASAEAGTRQSVVHPAEHRALLECAARFERSADWLDRGVLQGANRDFPLAGTMDYRIAAEALRRLVGVTAPPTTGEPSRNPVANCAGSSSSPVREPLTDAEVFQLLEIHGIPCDPGTAVAIAEIVERAHGIGVAIPAQPGGEVVPAATEEAIYASDMAAARMTEDEIHERDWWCPHCLKDVPPEMVTKDGEHCLESGGCGRRVRGELKDAAGVQACVKPSMDPQRQRELADPSNAAFEDAMRQTWEMVDPFNPPPPGSYARGSHEGICAALKTMRENYERERRKRIAGVGVPAQMGQEVDRG